MIKQAVLHSKVRLALSKLVRYLGNTSVGEIMYRLEELVQHLKECHKTTCVDGSVDFMRGFGEGYRAAIETLAAYEGISVSQINKSLEL